MKKYKSATVYHREGQLYVSSFVKTTTGLDVVSDPYSVLDNDISAEKLGKTIKSAIKKGFTADPIPHPDNFSDYPQLNEFLSTVGCRSWPAFAKKAVASQVKLLFDENGEPECFLVDAEVADQRGGFSDVGDRLELPSDVTDEALGEAVIERLKWAREQM